MTYPEHDKLAGVSAESQLIGEFLEWLQSEGNGIICERSGSTIDNLYWPSAKTIEAWLAAYFDIDTVTLEREKRAMLEEIKELCRDLPSGEPVFPDDQDDVA